MPREPWYVWASPHNQHAYRYGPYLTLDAAVKSMRHQFRDRRRRPRLDCQAPGAWLYTPPRRRDVAPFVLSIYRPSAAHLCGVPRNEVQFMLPMDGDAPIFIVSSNDIRKRKRIRSCTGSASVTA